MLAISLIILFLLSILGLAVMKTSSLEEKMAANALHEDITFQVTETVSADAMSNPQNMASAFASTTDSVDVDFSKPESGGHFPTIEASTTVSYTGEGLIKGFSLEIDNQPATGLKFIFDSVARIPDTNTSTRIMQGYVRMAPNAADE